MVVDDRKETAPPHAAAKPLSHSPSAAAAAAAKLEQSTLVSSRIWDVFSPPPTNTVMGAVVPRAFSKYSRRRRISVDINRVRVTHAAEVTSGHQQHNINDGNSHKPGSTQKIIQAENATYYEECVVRVFDPADKKTEKASRQAGVAARLRRKKGLQPNHQHGPNGATFVEHHEDDVSLLEIEEAENHHDHHHHNDDDMSVASTTGGVPEEYLDTGAVMIPQLAGWKPKFRFPVDIITIKGQHKTGVTVAIHIGHATQMRELVFDSRPDANEFVELIEKQKSLESERTAMKLKISLGNVVLKKSEEEITFLVEIVSGWKIPAGDFTSSDPYVICYIQGKEVHRTKHIAKTLDPIWTLKTNSLFLMTIDARDLFMCDGLLCELRDFDTIGSDEKLGEVIVPPKTIYEATGQRMEFKLQPPNRKVKEVPGHLALRIRKASEYDIQFMKSYYAEAKEEHHFLQTDIKNMMGGGILHTLVTKNVKKEREGPYAGQKKFRIRPGPDPKDIERTEWMTHGQIENEVLKESHHWLDAGSGTLGRLYVEVLGCGGLPNLDVGSFLGNKTDAFVAIVYQDTFVRTDVIDDCLNPRWLPWSQRAFIFRILHSSSELFLGVFDFDSGLDDHDPIGRVSINVSNFRPNTVYTVTYNLYPTARMKMAYREIKGTITLRMRVEIDDYRKFLLSSLDPPPDVYVNVKKKRDFRIVKFVCQGKIDMDAYSHKVIESYIDELLSYQQTLYYIQDALVALLMWHGHFDVSIGNKTYNLPLHSITAFLTAVLLVERPQLVPSFGFAMISWCLIAIMGWRCSLPDPWSRCKTFVEIGEALIAGVSTTPPDIIAPFENHHLTTKMIKEWEQRLAADAERAKKAGEEAQREKEEYEQEMEELGDTQADISTKKGGVSIDPLKPVLYPIQQYLGLICRVLRFVKYVLYWEECYFAFWIATGCLILAFAFLFVPWFWIIKWTARITVWAVFGPWLKLVDMFYLSKTKPLEGDALLEKQTTERLKKKEATSKVVLEARLRKENALKLKAMKKYLFGKFITRVPILKQDRFRDVPLPQSQAEPYIPVPIPLSELAMKEAGYRRTRLPGQQLVGDMIPQVQSLAFTDAPKGKATAHPNLLDQNGPGGGLGKGADSTSAAYAKIGSVVVAAGVVTWFGVPLMASIAEQVVNKF